MTKPLLFDLLIFVTCIFVAIDSHDSATFLFTDSAKCAIYHNNLQMQNDLIGP